MGHIKDIANQPQLQTFPGATYEIAGEVPANQCSEAVLEGIHAVSNAGANVLLENGAFTGWVLAGKVLTIVAPPANAGDYDIILNTNDILLLVQNTPILFHFNEWYVHDGGALILTRNAQSFFRYLQEYDTTQQFFAGAVTIGQPTITELGAFTSDFSGFRLDVINLAVPDYGQHTIISNTPDVLTTDHTFTVNNPAVIYDIHCPHPQPATLKGGTVFTTTPESIMQKACSILFNPLT